MSALTPTIELLDERLRVVAADRKEIDERRRRIADQLDGVMEELSVLDEEEASLRASLDVLRAADAAQ